MVTETNNYIQNMLSLQFFEKSNLHLVMNEKQFQFLPKPMVTN